mmetsp:Transcript_30215/g.100040  ORF Transcript_30215/g.100040 Transcript_30215/m.100040 type:complete len:80 (-) Transcript_30215:110-349(-)
MSLGFHTCEFDTERGLGRLLKHGGYMGIFVMVSRWYGGVQLGSDRFKILNRVLQTLLEKSGVESQPKAPTGKNAKNKKG